MLWKGSTTVGFGLKGKYVIAWYCPKGNTGDFKVFKKNVGTKCIATDGDMNKCFNDRALKAANAKRKLHGSPALKLDADAAKAIQNLMDADGYKTAGGKGPVTLGAGSAFKKCGQIHYNYSEQDSDGAAIVMTTDNTIDTWYKGKQFYDFTKGVLKRPADQKEILAIAANKRTTTQKNILAATKTEQENFTQLIWAGSTRVGFGVAGDSVVALFCEDKGNFPEKALDYVDNVSDVCVVDGYDRCYNKAALSFHNKKRALHKATKFLALDPAIATKIQLEMNKAGFAGAISDKGSYAACSENIFEQTVVSK
jgi:hypothetical protein